MLKRLALVLSLATVPAATAQVDTLTAGHAKTTPLADWYANIYYTVMEKAYEVVITMAPGPDDGGRPMRFVCGLADGESQEISIGGYDDDAILTTLTVSRRSDQVRRQHQEGVLAPEGFGQSYKLEFKSRQTICPEAIRREAHRGCFRVAENETPATNMISAK